MSDQASPADQRPNKLPDEDQDEIAPLDEAPDGQTPADTTDSSSDSLPPGN
ncbi:MAG TPA: hypothetical protein VIR58_10845 [Acidimicrobiales bacterium]